MKSNKKKLKYLSHFTQNILEIKLFFSFQIVCNIFTYCTFLKRNVFFSFFSFDSSFQSSLNFIFYNSSKPIGCVLYKIAIGIKICSINTDSIFCGFSTQMSYNSYQNSYDKKEQNTKRKTKRTGKIFPNAYVKSTSFYLIKSIENTSK